jgi:CHAD domain-containing protein
MATARARQKQARPAQVKEELRRRIGDASRRLRAKGRVSDKVVHDARKDLKRARATLRLLRPAVGDRTYTRENAALRDAARPLSAVRDTRVLMDTLDHLLERDENAAERALLLNLRARVEQARLGAREEIQQAGTLDKSAKALEDAWTRVDRWRISGKRASDLHKGLRRVYERGRKAFADVKDERSPENLHEWRKQVKYLGQAMEVLAPGEDGPLAKLIKRSASLANALGADHDLVVLQSKTEAVHSGSHNAHRALSAQIRGRRKKLQSKALKKGEMLYKPKPKRFIKRLKPS